MPYRKRLLAIVFEFTDNTSYLTFMDYIRDFSSRYDMPGTISVETFLVRRTVVASGAVQLVSSKYLVFRPYPILKTEDYWIEDAFTQFQLPGILKQYPVTFLTGAEPGTYEYLHD